MRPAGVPTELLLYGNVDLTQVQLAFDNSGRIAEVKFREGDRVPKGAVLATLDTSRLKPMVAQAEAQVKEKRAVFKRLMAGYRVQEKDKARENVKSAQAEANKVLELYERLKPLREVPLGNNKTGQAARQEDIDNAKRDWEVAKAKLAVSEKELDLVDLGPRQEEKDEAEARWQGSEAQLTLLKQQLADASLLAKDDYVVRMRLMEPGEMAAPSKSVFSLVIIDPKWVRAFVSEPDRGKVREGMKAEVAVDSFRDRRFEGTVRFISPVAEFTPKAVQTEELRTSLVYEVRVDVNDPEGKLCLGMPATVHVPLDK